MKTIKSTRMIHSANMARMLERSVSVGDRAGVKICRATLQIAGATADDLKQIEGGFYSIQGENVIIKESGDE